MLSLAGLAADAPIFRLGGRRDLPQHEGAARTDRPVLAKDLLGHPAEAGRARFVVRKLLGEVKLCLQRAAGT